MANKTFPARFQANDVRHVSGFQCLSQPINQSDSKDEHVTGAKRGKTCNQCQTRENMQVASSAGKYATSAKRTKSPTYAKHKKTCNWS